MKVLLIQPPVRVDLDPVDIPAGLGILASIAIQENNQVALMDMNVERPIPTWRDAAEQISVEKWDIIAMFVTAKANSCPFMSQNTTLDQIY